MALPCKESQKIDEAKELAISHCGSEGKDWPYIRVIKMNGAVMLLIAFAGTDRCPENHEHETSSQSETLQSLSISKDKNIKSTKPALANAEDKRSTAATIDTSELLEAPPAPTHHPPSPPPSPLLDFTLPISHPAVDLDTLPHDALHLQIPDELDISTFIDLESDSVRLPCSR